MTLQIEICDWQIQIDLEDAERILAQTWSVYLLNGKPCFLTRVLRNGKYVRTRIERFIMNPPEDMLVVKRKGSDPLDFRRCHLEIVSMAKRQSYVGKRVGDFASRYKGVSWDTKRDSWTASIRPNGLSFNLGVFGTEEEAALAYNEAAVRYYGEDAFQNEVSVQRKTKFKKA